MANDFDASQAATGAPRLQKAVGLHRLHRQLAGDRRRKSLGAKASAFSHGALRPLTRLVRTFGPTWRYGPEVVRRAQVPLWRQFLQQWIVAMRFDFTYDTYYRFRLYQLSRMKDAALFFPLNVHMALRGHLYAQLDVDPARLEDKRDFYRTCARIGLPVPPTVAEFEKGAGRAWPKGDEPMALPPRDLFSKPADSLEGKGAARWVWQETGRYRGEDGQLLTEQELLVHLEARSRSGPYLLQERLANHPAIAALGPNALCTVRIVTCRSADGSPEHLVSIFRMPSATLTAAADNFAAGGFASPVDPATGTLGNAVCKDLGQAATDWVEYPTSGRAFASLRLPHWDEALELCLRAHRLFAEFPSVGWDVAITPDGPVLVEGNHDWDVVLAQQPGARALGRTKYVDSYFSFLR